MRFLESCEFSGDPGPVWGKVSNLDGIPAYWHGTKEFRVTGRGEKTTADVVFAFGGKGKAEVIVDEKSRMLTIKYVDGPFRGKQTVAVKDDAVEAEWDVTFKGAFKILGPWNASHFRSGTRNALKRLCAGSAAASS
ncbi:MAG: hypothetical protein LYZ69_07225 [Nitrososphaerales archaeon]|nr:hypothetical protein [Nitrososphaerales archaeon]